MSSALSLAKPLPIPIRQCPYCDHVSPADSKFCNACGAALHLVPCPHCGAVNDITTTSACYRCHGELRESVAALTPAPAPVSVADAPAPPAEPELSPAETANDKISPPSARQRPHALIVGIVLIAFAAASYYAFRQRTALDVREPELAGAKGRAVPADTNANTGAGIITKAPADAMPAATAPIAAGAATVIAAPVELNALKPDAAPSREATPARTARTGKSASSRETAGPPAAPAIDAVESVRPRFEMNRGLEKNPPNIGPCTDAVAALGLCTPEPTPRRQ